MRLILHKYEVQVKKFMLKGNEKSAKVENGNHFWL